MAVPPSAPTFEELQIEMKSKTQKNLMESLSPTRASSTLHELQMNFLFLIGSHTARDKNTT
jgi:hypothetical protein